MAYKPEWAGDTAGVFTAPRISSLPSRPPSSITVTTFVPGDAGVSPDPEARIDYPPKGWIASANSVGYISEGYATFKVESNVNGVAIGLTTKPAPAVGYSYIEHGLLFTGGIIKSIDGGIEFSSYTRDDVFKIDFVRGARGVPFHYASITTIPADSPHPVDWGSDGYVSPPTGVFVFYKNDVVLFSKVVLYAPGSEYRLAASLYGAQDSVYDPALVPCSLYGYSSAILSGIEARSGTEDYSTSLAVIGGIQVSSGLVSRSTAELRQLVALSADRDVSQSYAEIGRLLADSYDGMPVVAISESFATVSGLSAASVSVTGGVGRCDVVVDGLIALSADREYAGSYAEIGALDALSVTDSGEVSFVTAVFGLFADLASQAVFNASITQTLGFGISLSGEVASDEVVDVAFSFDVAFSSSTIETASIDSVFWFDAPLECPGAFMDAWAVNLDNGASTEYRSYPFETVANIGGRYFGAAFEGLYELAGDTDAGAPIEAKFDIGRKDFGDHQLKRVENVYLGITSKGQMFVKVSAEGASYTYPMREFGEHIQTQRVTVGKGMRANYFGFEIGNTAGCDFEITSLNMMVAESARRI